MKEFLWFSLFLIFTVKVQAQTYRVHFGEIFDNGLEQTKDTFIMQFSKKLIMHEYKTKKPFNKVIFDLKHNKQYIISDLKKIILYSESIKQDTNSITLYNIEHVKEKDTLYYSYKNKFIHDTLITEDPSGNIDTVVQKIIFSNNWPFNAKNYFVTINILGFFSYPKGWPIYLYTKSTSNYNERIELFERSIYKVEKSKRTQKINKIQLPKNYTYMELTHENIKEVLLRK